MTQTTDHSAPSGKVFDLTTRLPPEARAHLEQAARDHARMSAAGLADTGTGTVKLSAEIGDQDLVVEQLDDGRRGLKALVPASLTNPDVWRHRGEILAHAAGYHAAHSPVYVWRIAKLSSIGLWAEISTAWGYLLATEYGADIDEAKREAKKKGFADNGDVAQLRAERRQHGKARRRENLTVLSATGFTSYVAAVVGISQVWGLAMTVPALIPVVGVLYACGARELRRRGDDFVVFEAAAEAEDAPLTDTLMNRALRTAGVFTRDDQQIKLTTPIRAAEINGVEAAFRAEGITVSKLLAKSEDIAGALDVPEDWIDIRSLGSPSHISFWMTDRDPFAEHRPSPLLTHSGPIDAVKDGIPASFDKRGRSVTLKLVELMMLVGGATRAGKGLVLRNLVCGAALDMRVRIRIATGKKPAEHSVYAPVLATYMHKQPRRLSMLLDLLEKDIDDRSRKLARKGRSTPSDQDLEEMGIELLIIDEAADYLDTNTPSKAKNELAEELTVKLDSIARAGAGVGVFLVIAVQDPKKGMIDTRLIANLLERWALRVADANSANAVLGSGSVGKGMRPQDIKRAQAPLGIRKGAEGEILTRAYMIDQNERGEAATIIKRAVQLRGQLGLLPGQRPDPIENMLVALTGRTTACGGLDGLGDPAPAAQGTASAEGEVASILAELLALFEAASNPQRMKTSELLAGLEERDPDRWSAAALGVAEDDTTSYVRTGGGELRKAIDAELDGTGRTLAAKGWTAGGRANGYYLAEVRAAAGIAPE
ncbi:FtsK/SpoIIIE domain-containing protein (plasmid) [Streptomyces sp. NBC_01732]|uniref:hypothetical protein n=1 Tax=Streptomyces sp. NBC_01732 TaxID=2975926 RepID=UPI00352DABB9|nr:FtsK/SpoIIIE domain-containing protein [Streptomyces sp. NBC_01732]